jgi:muramidase (phage lysozyme)
LCNDLSGNLDAGKIEEKLLKVNNAFADLYSGMESKHIQDELLQTINRDVRQIEKLANEVTSEMRSYEKLRTEKPYSFVASLFGFSKLPELSVS